MIEFGRVGRLRSQGVDITFMVLCETLDPALRVRRDCVDVIILSGSVPFRDRIYGFGDIGPIATTQPDIEWLS